MLTHTASITHLNVHCLNNTKVHPLHRLNISSRKTCSMQRKSLNQKIPKRISTLIYPLVCCMGTVTPFQPRKLHTIFIELAYSELLYIIPNDILFKNYKIIQYLLIFMFKIDLLYRDFTPTFQVIPLFHPFNKSSSLTWHILPTFYHYLKLQVIIIYFLYINEKYRFFAFPCTNQERQKTCITLVVK